MQTGAAGRPAIPVWALLTALACLVVAGCGEEPATLEEVALPEAQQPAEVEAAGPSPRVMGQWARNCALCHVRGEGGAPVVGDGEAWRGRLARGDDALLAHTLEGFNNMPPLGYCMDCDEADFRGLIRFMAGTP